MDSGLAVTVFNQGDDLISCLYKEIDLLTTVASLRFPSTNNQLSTSSNQRNQATIQDGGQAKVVKCYNCQGEGHMAKQCTQTKRPRNASWFKEKVLLVQAQAEAFQTDDLDVYDSNCDDISSAIAVLMANLSSCDSDVLTEDSTCLGLRMISRLSLKNNMPLRDKKSLH
nr:hypothetical protein [Tanacetum cinerariifolium]